MNGRKAVIRALGYVDNVRIMRRRMGDDADLLRLAYCFVPWWRSFSNQDTLSLHSVPWLTYPAIQFLRRSVRPDWKVFEFGSGASTMFFGNRCREVISIEHDTTWAKRVRSALQCEGLSNCKLRYIPPVVSRVEGMAYGS